MFSIIVMRARLAACSPTRGPAGSENKIIAIGNYVIPGTNKVHDIDSLLSIAA